MFLGIDIGTSAIKAILVDESQRVVAQASHTLEVQRPQPLWSEQDPAAWWSGTCAVVGALRHDAPDRMAALRGIGLSGQMHGATLLDAGDRVLRPAILWNDGRSGAQCAELEEREPRSRAITGNLAMPGFTAPKLLWVAEHEPEIFKHTARVLLPKDYVRLVLSGERVSDMSDAAGTLWLDVGRRRWSAEMLAATRLPESAMPRLCEGFEASAALRPDVAAQWGVPAGVVIAGGGGDNAAGAVGVGVIRPGQAFLSLGTSGVYFVVSAQFNPRPERAVHTFCHALSGTWHQMSVILSAASCVSWIAAATGAPDEGTLLAEIEAAGQPANAMFLPYLSGERTPHNDPHATGVFCGLGHDTTRAELGRAVLEGVAFALADGQAALMDSGTQIDDVCVIGGGARSPFWGEIIASVLDRPLRYHGGGELGPAFGAARLARLALTGEEPSSVCTPPNLERVIEPNPRLQERYAERIGVYRRLYDDLRETFPRLR